MRWYLRPRFAILVAVFVILLGLTMPVYAGESLQGRPANMVIEPPQPFVIGTQPSITVHLFAEFGQPIPNQPIIIFLNGLRKSEGKTDSQGIAVIPLKYKFAAGQYLLTVIYPGIPSIGVNSATAQTELVIVPSKVAIYTVPPTPGVKFKLNDQVYTSDANGVVDFQLNLSGIYSLEVLPINEQSLPPNTRLEFARWNDNVFTPKRQVYFPRNNQLEVGFTINYQVNQEFYDTQGNPVNPARVSSMTLRGIGNTYTFNGAGPIWLPANRLTRRVGEHLESEEIVYYFRDVVVDGANVINQSEQRFHIRPNDVWPIQVLLYSVHFTASDAMFHFPIGKGIELTYPDGHKQEFLFQGDKKEIVIPSLARGSYSAKIIGAGGSAPPTPIHLSRDQDADLLMLSNLDIGVIFGIPLVIAVVFFFIGRPRWLRVIRHPLRSRELVYQNNSGDVR